MRLIDADALEKELEKMTQDFLDDKTIQGNFCAGVTVETLEEVRKASTVDAVPVNELLKLRDRLYESDGITMGGLRSLNELIAKYSSNPLPRIENGFERRNYD